MKLQKGTDNIYDDYNSNEARKIGQNLKRIRQNNGLSQEAFAELIGVSRQTVINWEKGNSLPSVDKVGIIIDKCSTSIEEILGKETVCNRESECEGTACFACGEEICASVAERKSDLLKIALITGLAVFALLVLFIIVVMVMTVITNMDGDAYAMSYAFSLSDKDKLILAGIALVVAFVGISTGVAKMINKKGSSK